MELFITILQIIEEHKFGDWLCCFVVCLCVWFQCFVEDGVGGAHDQDKKNEFFCQLNIFFSSMIVCFFKNGFMFVVVILAIMVWEECLLYVELDFLMLKLKKKFVENVAM
jgi:hypothetical protein